jgi:hypothetical protein
MKKVMFLIFALALSLMFTAAPVLAAQPKLTFTFACIQYPTSEYPGTSFTTGDVVHTREIVTGDFIRGTPWGGLNQRSIANFKLNVESFKGSGVSKFVDTGATSPVHIQGSSVFKFQGFGVYTYHGLTFTAITNRFRTFQVTEGTIFTGILMEGTSVSHGTVNGESAQLRTEYTGVSISGLLSHDLEGVNILSGTVTYWFTG